MLSSVETAVTSEPLELCWFREGCHWETASEIYREPFGAGPSLQRGNKSGRADCHWARFPCRWNRPLFRLRTAQTMPYLGQCGAIATGGDMPHRPLGAGGTQCELYVLWQS